MRRASLTLAGLAAAALVAGLAAGTASAAAGVGAGPLLIHSTAASGHAGGEVLVRFRDDAAAGARASAMRRSGVRSSRALPLSGLRLLRLDAGVGVRTAIARLERDSAVRYAQPNHHYRLAALPRDPRFGEQWGLNATGQTVQSLTVTPDADIDAPEAWDLTGGSRSVIAAIADSGLAYDHPELSPNLWLNAGEGGKGRESNGRDDDRNGLVDDWRGWDFAGKDNDIRDLNGHGTHVAGIAGARANNGLGIAGVSWDISLMALRVASSSGVVSDAAIISAFDYAAAEGARVVNASFVSSAVSEALRESIRRHPKLLFVAAAGNGGDDGVGDDNDASPQYPCAFTLVNLVCVAASDPGDRLAPFSNFGRTSVDLTAPGQSVLSAAPAFGPPVFSDGFETDLAGLWVTGGTNDTWARITAVANTGSYSLSDSPGTTYQNNTDTFVRTAAPFSLAGGVGCRVDYALRLSTEPDVDKLLVEVSSDGASWTGVSESSGSSLGAFLGLSDDLSAFDGAPSLFLRFRLVTNGSGVADGAQIDDVAVRCLGSSYSGNELAFADGTSMAAPHVTGTAALAWARYPRLGAGAVREALFRGVDTKPALSGRVATGGRLNARGTLDRAARLVLKLKLSGAARQRALRKRRLVVNARCSRRCQAIATGTLSIAGASRKVKLKRVTRALAGGRRKKLVIRLGPGTLRSARRALARGRRVQARVTVTATDSRGSWDRQKRKVRFRG